MEGETEDLSAFDSFSFWKNIALVTVFLLLTPLTIVTSVFSLNIIKTHTISQEVMLNPVADAITPGVQVFASLPSNFPSVSGGAETADSRAVLVKNYLASYNSKLEPFTDTLMEASDHHKLDYRLLPSIAMQESSLCKFIPEDSHNCWGWGIHSKGSLGFESFEEAIWTVAKGLKEEYIDKGYTTPVEIMGKYTPLSNGSWAVGVTRAMSEIEDP